MNKSFVKNQCLQQAQDGADVPCTWAHKDPVWSPDGTKIAFSSMRDDATWGEIYTMNADGTDVIRLTDNNTYDGTPSWSP